ncbi:MAG: hypothetical protein PHQ22_10425 [Sulfuricurvum sp.]|nr:hypothetical protein [Sulfuricurvum sp.]
MKQKEKEITLEPNSKVDKKESYEYAEVLKQVIVDKKAELDTLKNQIMSLQGRLQTTQASILQEKNAFDNHTAHENKKIEDAQKKLKSDTDESLRKVDYAQRDMTKRETELSLREQRIKDLEDEKKNLIDQRITLGKLSFDLDLKLKSAQETKDIADEKINSCAAKSAELDKKEKAVESRNRDIDGREEKVAADLKQAKSLKTEITQLRDEIKPQLEALENKKQALILEQKNLDTKLEQVVTENAKTQELLTQMEARTKQVEEKKKELFAKETELSQREARVVLLEISGA